MKNYTQTILYVYFAGNLRIASCDKCCSRWYFTFSGAECSSPSRIDGAYYMATTAPGKNLYRTVTVTLKDTAMTFTRENCEWDFGLETAIMAMHLLTHTQAGPQCPGSSLKKGAIHSTKLSGNFGPKLNGSVRSNRKSFEKTGPPFEVVLFSRSDRLEFWLNGSRPKSQEPNSQLD